MNIRPAAAALLIGLTLACKDKLGPAAMGTIGIRFESPEFMESARAVVAGPDTQTVTLTRDGQGYAGVSQPLAPGAYHVAAMGLKLAEVHYFGANGAVSVNPGERANTAVAIHSFIPVVDSQTALTTDTRFTVRWNLIADADSYRVEMGRSSASTDPELTTTTATSAQVTVRDSGTFFYRVRALNRWVTRGGTNDPNSIRVATNPGEPGDNLATGGTALGYGVRASRTLAGLNILPVGDQDWFSIGLCVGDTLFARSRAARLDPPSPLNSQIQIFDPGNELVHSSDDADLTDSYIELGIAQSGRHQIRVSSTEGTTGQYELVLRVVPGPNAGEYACRLAGSPVAEVLVTPGASGIITPGNSQPFTAVARDAQHTPVPGRPVSWFSTNLNVAAIGSTSGIVSPVASGQTTIAATVDGITGYALLTVELQDAATVGTWTPVTSGVSQPLSSIWGTSPTDAYVAVGAGGTFLRFANGTWSTLPGGVTRDLNHVWGISPSDVYAVGAEGLIARYDGIRVTAQASGTGQDLYGIWGSSPVNLFAVGNAGTILHFDGGLWRTMSSPTTERLNAVWGVAPDRAYAVGGNGTILRFDGTAWTRMTSPTSQPLLAIWGLSSALWAVGNNGTILRFDGTTWSVVPAAGDVHTFRAVWGTSATDVYAVGEAGTILRFNGTVWSRMSSPTSATLTGLWGSYHGSVFAVGAGGLIARGARGTLSNTVSIRVTPGAAQATAVGAAVTFTAVALDASGGVIAGKTVGWTSLNPDVANVNAVTGVATIAAAGQAVISATTDGVSGFALINATVAGLVPVGSWSNPAAVTVQNLTAVWGATPTDAFAVGAAGTVMHFDGLGWSQMASGTSQALYGIWGWSRTSAIAVGAGGTVLRYDGTSWTTMPSGTMQTLRAVWGASPADVFAAGDGGTILRYNNDTGWSPVSSGTTQGLRGLWGRSPSAVFAVGTGGTALTFNGTAWAPMTSGVATTLSSIWGTSGTELFAVGDGGVILRYVDGAWAGMASPVTAGLGGVWGSSASDIYVAGIAGTIMRYNGDRWITARSPSATDLSGVWGYSNGGLFVVGRAGANARGRRGAARVAVSPAGASMSGTGTTQAFSAQAFNADDILMSGATFTWSALNPTVLTVGPSGLATATGSGQGELAASTDGVTGYALATVSVNPVRPVAGWASVASPTTQSLRAAWGTSPALVFAVGDAGTVVRLDQTGTWQPMSSGTSESLLGIWGPEATNAFATGINHAKLRYIGGQWDVVQIPVTPKIYAIWGASLSSIFAGGDSGTVMAFDGSAWNAQASNTTQNLRSMWGLSASDVYAVGAGGVIIHFDGVRWAAMPTSGTWPALTALWGTSPTDVFAVGATGTILHWNGTTWTSMASGTTQTLRGIWGASRTDVYAVGDGGTILRFNGTTWTASTSSVVTSLMGVWGTASSDVWVVGAGGRILKGIR